MSAVLDLQGVTVRRGPATLVDSIDWKVAEGERWIVLGPNGAGKTTLLDILAARSFPSAGTVDLLGERLGKVNVFELRPRIGFASAALAERIPRDETVRNVVLTAAYGVTGRWREEYEDLDESRADDLLAAFDVAGLADRLYGTLSEGERKRVQIARALMTDPEVLLLDEPAAGLDLAGREELVGALAELAADPASPVLVVVTHHVEEIPPGFTHLLLLGDGTVEAAGPIEEVLTAENLSRAFGMDLLVAHGGGRWLARAARPVGR
ncbi:iron complex transport system ATP-binding protein [Isoptericola jiangsuensis]|uniref:Iron complex transport system ATP-binding protein n=1 Tax=Isoptericola jiangsuensis TaxID=548579 RepID=A0A2A9EXS3_9MICO|nr:ABC transporter ATP-binding protein [Isoptericola jiangsuensis]PFG42969.1 iron complex transport system ATP-binding protein [Isoptericola jiangsuensis]